MTWQLYEKQILGCETKPRSGSEVCDSLAHTDCVLMCWCHLACKASVKGKEDAIHALERRQSPTEEAAKFGQRLNERSQREGTVVGAWRISVQPRAMLFGTGIAKRVTSVEMPDESGAGAQRNCAADESLERHLLALEPQRDDRPGGDVYAVAMGGKEVGHPGQKLDLNVSKKRNTSEWRLLTDLSLRRFWICGMTEIQDNLISHDFHIRTDCCFTVKSMMSSNTFMSKAFPR